MVVLCDSYLQGGIARSERDLRPPSFDDRFLSIEEGPNVLYCGISSFQPMEIYVDDEAKLTLHGLVQHYIKLTELEKNRKLNDLLDALDFNQVVIFVKSVSGAAELNKLLLECNFPSICIHSGMSQEERLVGLGGLALKVLLSHSFLLRRTLMYLIRSRTGLRWISRSFLSRLTPPHTATAKDGFFRKADFSVRWA